MMEDSTTMMMSLVNLICPQEALEAQDNSNITMKDILIDHHFNIDQNLMNKILTWKLTLENSTSRIDRFMYKSCRMRIPVKRVTDLRFTSSKNQMMNHSLENRKREFSRL
jgi:hypothetical protein